ncbi:N-acetylneuraminate synthase family protein [Roseivirga sp.]|uniref:N-acetylneuraminate synthase family protein n=1 Tax=Roseivirga sp. TaxID=1964215 RepID=UPI003B8E81D7
MSKVSIIAEVGQAHDGSLGILHSYIDALSGTGVDVVKFQTHVAKAESSEQEPFRVNFSYEDNTRFDYWERMAFTFEQWVGIKSHCEEVGLEFMSSPFSLAAVEILECLNVNRYKIGSGEVNNLLLLERIARTGKPIIISSGMSNYNELEASVNFLKPYGNHVSILQCTTSYPTKGEHLGLNVIEELKKHYPDLPIGFSDHSGNIYAGLAAVSLGAKILEFHVTFDKRMFGPDASSSLEIEEVKRLVEGVRFIEKSLQHPVDKNDLSPYETLKPIFEKSLAVNKPLSEGHILQQEDLESKKPSGMGVPAKDYQKVIGKKLMRRLKKYDFLTYDDLNEL